MPCRTSSEQPRKASCFPGNNWVAWTFYTSIQLLKYHPRCCVPRLVIGRKMLGHPAFTGAHDWHPKICQAVAGQGLWRWCSSDPDVTLVAEQLDCLNLVSSWKKSVATCWGVVNSKKDTVDVVQPFNIKLDLVYPWWKNIAHEESSLILQYLICIYLSLQNPLYTPWHSEISRLWHRRLMTSCQHWPTKKCVTSQLVHQSKHQHFQISQHDHGAKPAWCVPWLYQGLLCQNIGHNLHVLTWLLTILK